MILSRYKLPTHLLLGVRKGATSWIWKQFTDHPEVYAHPKKEISYFNKHISKGLNWYRKQFDTDKEIILDATPDYFYFTHAREIKKTIRNANVLVCLRNPIERAYSHWKFGKYIGTCKQSFKDSWDSDWHGVRTRGLYDKHLSAFLEFFDIKVVLYDNLIKDPNSFIGDVYDLFGVTKHQSEFFGKKWMPGEVSKKNKEKEYETISRMKMSEQDHQMVKDYYVLSIQNTSEILSEKLTWLNS